MSRRSPDAMGRRRGHPRAERLIGVPGRPVVKAWILWLALRSWAHALSTDPKTRESTLLFVVYLAKTKNTKCHENPKSLFYFIRCCLQEHPSPTMVTSSHWPGVNVPGDTHDPQRPSTHGIHPAPSAQTCAREDC